MNFSLVTSRLQMAVSWPKPQQHLCHQRLAGALEPDSGFSLTELVVIVALISLLTGLALGSQSKRVQNERLKTGTQSLAAWLDGVRVLAIQRSETCAIRVSAADRTLSLQPYGIQTSACPSERPSFDLQQASESTNIILCAAAQGPAAAAPICNASTGSLQILFTPKGTSPTNALLQTHLNGTDQNRCIQLVAPLGLLRIGKVIGGSCNWNTAS